MDSKNNQERNEDPDIKSNQGNFFYSATLKEHFFNPKNFVRKDQPEFEANGVGEVGSPACGDVMKMWVKINPDTEVIKDCGWKTFGCGSAIASTSVLSQMIKGMNIKKALKISPQDIQKKLGGLPQVKIHCSVLGDKALEGAIDDYFKNTEQFDRIKNKDQHIVDEQTQTTQQDIEKAVKNKKATSFKQLQEQTKVGAGNKEAEKKARKIFKHYKKKLENSK